MAVPLPIPGNAIRSIDTALGWKHDLPPETLSTGIESLDGAIEGCPRGRITEIVGPVSSGRTTMMHSVMAEATRMGETCAVVDTSNSFDAQSAAAAGVVLDHVLVVRCGGDANHALRAADLLVHSGGFGVITLDLCDVPDRELRRIPLSCWYRFRRAIENTPTVLLLVEREAGAKSCSSLLLEMNRERTFFSGTYPFQYLDEIRFQARPRKPVNRQPACFEVKAL
jgi:hypothetical protein